MAKQFLIVIIGILLVALGFYGFAEWFQQQERALNAEGGSSEASTSKWEPHSVYIRKPDGAPKVDSGRLDFHGQPAQVSCATCHTTREPNPAQNSAADLTEFHQGLHYQHAGMSCLSCHNSEDYDSLRLASGLALPFTEVMTLCAQCHGTQKRDYDNGAHGGMVGHWNLQKGPRVRNNCTDCHDPHAPAYPQVQPVFQPKDRIIDTLQKLETEKAH